MTLTKIEQTKRNEKCILCQNSYNVYHLTIGEEFGRELFSQPVCYSCLCLIGMDLCREIGIDEEVICDAIESELISAYNNNFGSLQNVSVPRLGSS